MSGPLDEPFLRPMQREDIPAVMVLERQLYPIGWTSGIFEDCLRVGYCCWVWEESQAIVGYGIMSVGAGEAHILNLATRIESQRRGLGRRMLQHLIHLARRHRADTAFLEVRPSNPGALALYQQLGFDQIGMRRGYYPSPQGREDAILMARTL